MICKCTFGLIQMLLCSIKLVGQRLDLVLSFEYGLLKLLVFGLCLFGAVECCISLCSKRVKFLDRSSLMHHECVYYNHDFIAYLFDLIHLLVLMLRREAVAAAMSLSSRLHTIQSGQYGLVDRSRR